MVSADVRDAIYREVLSDFENIKGLGKKTAEKVADYISKALEERRENILEIVKSARGITKEAREKLFKYLCEQFESENGIVERYLEQLPDYQGNGGEDNGNHNDKIQIHVDKIDTAGRRGTGDIREIGNGNWVRVEVGGASRRINQDDALYTTRGIKEWYLGHHGIDPMDIISREEDFDEEAVNVAKYYTHYRDALKNNFEKKGIRKLTGRWDSRKAEEIIKAYRSGADEKDLPTLEAAFDVVAHVKGYDYLLKNYRDALEKFEAKRRDVFRSCNLDESAFQHIIKYEESLANDIYRFIKDNKDKVAKATVYGLAAAATMRALEDPNTFITAVNNTITGNATYFPHAAPTAVGGVLGGMAGLWAEEKLTKYKDNIKSGLKRFAGGVKKKLGKLFYREKCPLEG